jgi:cell division septation protein DedD
VQGSSESGRSGGNPWDVPSTDDIDEDDEPLKPVPRISREPDDAVADEYDVEEDWDEEEYEEPEVQEEYRDDDGGHGWPVGLIIVAVVALVLLAAGGYGVVQQRAATQAEIRELQAALATAASPAEVAQTREDLQAMEQDLAQRLATIDTLTLENRRLTDTVAGLESQLAAQQAAASTARPAPKAAPKPKPAPKAAPKPAAAKPAATASGDWFVNFSSYSQRSAAESWLAKIKPAAGKAVIQPVTSNGSTLYRLRIVGLADRSQAEKVAAQLQSAHGLPKLWVGSE